MLFVLFDTVALGFLERISLTLFLHLEFIAARLDLDYCARTAYPPLIST